MSTIKKVAKEAGVSTATVSRVLNGNYPVSQEAYNKVMEAVKKTGYKGNAIAKSLKMNRTFMIGFVVPDISNPYFMEVAKGIEEEISKYNYTLTICSTNEDPAKEKEILSLLSNKRVDAVVLASCHQDSQMIKSFVEEGLKVILFDSKMPGLNINYVGETNYLSSVELLEHAIKKGHQRLAIINGDMRMGTARERYRAYKDVLAKHGLVEDSAYILQGDYQKQVAYEALKGLLNKQVENPSLVYAVNNKMAEGALIAIKEVGLRIPEDISIVSYGNISIPELVNPKLTYINQKTDKLGLELGILLKEILVDKLHHLSEKIIQLNLVEGQSVKHMK